MTGVQTCALPILLVPEGLVGLHRPFNFSLFGINGWGIDLDYCDIEWFVLEMNPDLSVIFEVEPSTACWTLLLTTRATPFLLRDSFTQ